MGFFHVSQKMLQDVTNFIDLICLRPSVNEQKMLNSVYTRKHSKLHMNKYI